MKPHFSMKIIDSFITNYYQELLILFLEFYLYTIILRSSELNQLIGFLMLELFNPPYKIITI